MVFTTHCICCSDSFFAWFFSIHYFVSQLVLYYLSQRFSEQITLIFRRAYMFQLDQISIDKFCAVTLSFIKIAGSGNSSLKNSARLFVHMTSFAASVNAQYSASVLDRVTLRCLRDTAMMGPPGVFVRIRSTICGQKFF